MGMRLGSGAHASAEFDAWRVWVAVGLALSSAIFAGLTLGLMTLDVLQLKVFIECGKAGGPESQASRYGKYAKGILKVRKNGNLLLVTLLILNVGVNAGFSILMGDSTSGLTGFLISTSVITIFGEIFPQAIFSRYALPICYWFVPLVIACEILVFPLALPLAAILNCLLGHDIGRTYTREQLAQLIKHHSEGQVLQEGEGLIIGGGLTVANKKAVDAMTPLLSVYGIWADEIVSFDVFKRLIASGYSRFAVFVKDEIATSSPSALSDSPLIGRRIKGFLYLKDLVLLNPNEEISARSCLAIFGRSLCAVDDQTPLLSLLDFFKAGKSHVAVVRKKGEGNEFTQLGIITLEDIIEVILQDEILDEYDEAPDPLAGDSPECLQTSDSIPRAKLAISRQSGRDVALREARMQLLYEHNIGSHLSEAQARVVQHFLRSTRLPAFALDGDQLTASLIKAPLLRVSPGQVIQPPPETDALGFIVVIQGKLIDGSNGRCIGAWNVINAQPAVLIGGPTGCACLLF